MQIRDLVISFVELENRLKVTEEKLKNLSKMNKYIHTY